MHKKGDVSIMDTQLKKYIASNAIAGCYVF